LFTVTFLVILAEITLDYIHYEMMWFN